MNFTSRVAIEKHLKPLISFQVDHVIIRARIPFKAKFRKIKYSNDRYIDSFLSIIRQECMIGKNSFKEECEKSCRYIRSKLSHFKTHQDYVNNLNNIRYVWGDKIINEIIKWS